MSKKVVVLVQDTPFNTDKNTEALRMAVGQCAGEHAVAVLFLDDGVTMLRALHPRAIGADDTDKHLRYCLRLGARLMAEKDALAQRGIAAPQGVETVNLPTVARLLSEADVVLRL